MKRPRILTYRPSTRKYSKAKLALLTARGKLSAVTIGKAALAFKRGVMSKDEYVNIITSNVENTVELGKLRIKNTHDMTMAAIQARMALQQCLIVQSQPIPKYPPGGLTTGGLAVVGERGAEVIHRPGSFQTDKIGDMVHHLPR